MCARMFCLCVDVQHEAVHGRAVEEGHLKVESRGKMALQLISQLCHWDGPGRISSRKVPGHINILKYISLGAV